MTHSEYFSVYQVQIPVTDKSRIHRLADDLPRGVTEVTEALLSQCNATVQTVVYADMNMETTNSIRIRVSRFFSDRYAYRTQPNYISELAAFWVIVLIAAWPMVLLANAIALSPK